MTAVLTLATILDPTVVLAFWTLACLTALLVGLLTAWAVQIADDGDPFARRYDLKGNIGELLGRHAAIDDTDRNDRYQPQHTRRAVAARRAAEAAAAPGAHHTGDRRLVASLLDTQAVMPAAELLADIDDLRERAA